MTKKDQDKLLRTLLSKLVSRFRPFQSNNFISSLSYTTDRGEVSISVDSENNICVSQRCFPAKEGWSFSKFKNSPRGISAAVRRAEAEIHSC